MASLDPISGHHPVASVEMSVIQAKKTNAALTAFTQQTLSPQRQSPAEPLTDKQIKLDRLPGMTSIKTEQVTAPLLNKIKKYSGFLSDRALDFLNYIGLGFIIRRMAVKLEGVGYVESASMAQLSKHLIVHMTGDEKLSEKYKSSSVVQAKIQYFIKKHKGIQGLQTQLQNVDTLKQHKFKNITKVDVLCTLDQLDPNNLKQIPCSNSITEDIKKNLKPGDILFFQHREKKLAWSGVAIVNGQKLAQLWLRGELEPQSETYTHAAIYIGNGKFAEAVNSDKKEDVRIFSFDDDPKLMLKEGDERSYRVCRPQNHKIALRAARLAKQYADDKTQAKRAASVVQTLKGTGSTTVKEEIAKWFKRGEENLANLIDKFREGIPNDYLKTKLNYSLTKAATSVFGDADFRNKAKEQVWRQIIELKNKAEMPRTGEEPTQFFCSEFVTECIQRGNVMQLLPWISKKIKEPIPKLTGNSMADKRITQKWVDRMMKEHPNLLDKLVMQFDPKYVSPQKLRSIIGSNPQLFKDVISIVPPKPQK